MIGIKKGKTPDELTTYILKRNYSHPNEESEGEYHPTYEGMRSAKVSEVTGRRSDKTIYEIVLESLAREQGYLCAYCMKRISDKSGGMSIEHIKPQNATDEAERLDYKNMVAVCSGYRNCKDNRNKTCDARRGCLPVDKQDLYLNPLRPETLKSIRYKSNGFMFSDIPEASRCINEVLNLNCLALQLPDARKRALEELENDVYKHFKDRTATKAYLKKQLNYFTNQEKKTPFVGILIDWLERRLER